MEKQDTLGEEALYQSQLKCFKGVGRKHSAQNYRLNALKNTIELAEELRQGKYKPHKPTTVQITYPKKRTALSITFRDRVVQRSLNDNVLYPQMVKGFVYHNMACQIGKGTSDTLNCFEAMLKRAYIKYGTNQFYILSGDIQKYYDNMVHEVTDNLFATHIDKWAAEMARETLNRQYNGEKGYRPGSQMVQIAGISYLDGVDHFAKEVMRTKMYIRYMDDLRIVCETEEKAAIIKTAIGLKLKEVGLNWHPEKTKIIRADKGAMFLGFVFRVTRSGHVVITRDPAKVKDNRRKLMRLKNKVLRGESSVEDFVNSYECMRACFSRSNSVRYLKNMDNYYRKLRYEIRDRHSQESVA